MCGATTRLLPSPPADTRDVCHMMHHLRLTLVSRQLSSLEQDAAQHTLVSDVSGGC